MGYLDNAGLQYFWGKLKEKFAPKSHSHDDRYYTEAEMDGKLNSKVDNNEAGADSLLSKLTTSWTATPTDDTYFIRQDTGGANQFGRVKFSTIWNYIKGKADGTYQPKGSYAASGHTHDDRYYTESEIDSKLSGKANSNHSHYSITTVADNRNTNTTPNDYRNTFIFQGLKDNSKINSPSSDTYSYLLGLRGWNDPSGGNSHELAFNNTGVYWRNGSTEWNGWNRLYTENYHPNADHASSADYATNAGSANGVTPEWSGSVDLSSSSWLAAWSSDGKKIKAMSTGTFAKASHTHTKAQVGLSNVDNTADANKSVKYATSAGSASSATKATSADSAGKLTMGDNQTALSGTTSPTAGLTVNKVYDNGYPTTYGNVITVHGSGSGQIVAGWSGTSGAVERLYYRNKRDTSDANWSSWKTVAFTDDKPAAAGTADSATTSNGVKDYNDANRTIKIGFAGAGLTAENLNYIAGYTENGTKIKDVSKDVLKSWIGLGNYLPLVGGTMSGQITKSTGGSWIGDRERATIKSSYAGDSSYGAVAAMATKNGYWTMGNLGGNESLIFNYSTDANYNAGKNETSQVYLPAQAGTIITSATIGSQSVNYANSAGSATSAGSVAWGNVSGKPSTFTPASHTHDDRYYTKTEVNTKLDGKSNTGHTHDDRYYTESEVNTKLANYQPKGNYAAASHTHNYAGSGTAGGSANSAVKLDSSAGSATQPVYFKDGKPVATTYTLNKTVPADAKFTDTDTWRGIQNNLTSNSTDQSLSAAQGKILKTLVDGKAPISHTHKKSQITDFPSSMPASDVYAWAKAATKPSYTKAEVGLGNVDNTADKDKNVKFATTAGSVTNAQCLNNDDKYMKFHWSGQDGQPTWLWGGNDSGDMYVYNPSNFNVNYATTAGSADNGVAASSVNSSGYPGYIRFNNGIQICWGVGSSGSANGSFFFPQSFLKAPCIMISGTGAYRYAFYVTNNTTKYFSYLRDGSGETAKPQYVAIGLWK